MLVEERAEIEQRLRQPATLMEENGNQQTPRASIAIHERMNRLELIVD
jgi:hypothetical protein